MTQKLPGYLSCKQQPKPNTAILRLGRWFGTRRLGVSYSPGPHLWYILSTHKVYSPQGSPIRGVLSLDPLFRQGNGSGEMKCFTRGHRAGQPGNSARTGRASSINHGQGPLLWRTSPLALATATLTCPMSYYRLSWALLAWKVPGGSESGVYIVLTWGSRLCPWPSARCTSLWLLQLILEQLC